MSILEKILWGVLISAVAGPTFIFASYYFWQ